MEKSYSKQEKELLIKVGSRVREARIKSGLTQEKLSFESNLDRTYIGSVERGERNISIINLNKIAIALKISIVELLNIDNE